jgi:2,4-diketo-3-deoxy-L-fuconate hydrolase
MRLVTYRFEGAARPGLMVEGGVVDLGGRFPSLLALIEAGEPALEEARALARGGRPDVPADRVRLLAPIPSPVRNVFCVGWNYRRHYDEGSGKRAGQDQPLPDHPAFFTKPPLTVIGPDEPWRVAPGLARRLDYEAELCVVVGPGGRDIDEADAMAHVFGYTAGNDLTARDVQRAHGGQWFKGKALDGSCPLGPWIVTRDEVPDPHDLRVRCWVNGELRQDASTADMIFSVARLIAELSRGMTLLAGDVVMTGTPEGVGYAMDPPRYLQPGDEVVVEVTGVGRIANRIASA